ncbi:hypothetical protein P7K49_002370, partial [Saguinus oedipus]
MASREFHPPPRGVFPMQADAGQCHSDLTVPFRLGPTAAHAHMEAASVQKRFGFGERGMELSFSLKAGSVKSLMTQQPPHPLFPLETTGTEAL